MRNYWTYCNKIHKFSMQFFETEFSLVIATSPSFLTITHLLLATVWPCAFRLQDHGQQSCPQVVKLWELILIFYLLARWYCVYPINWQSFHLHRKTLAISLSSYNASVILTALLFDIRIIHTDTHTHTGQRAESTGSSQICIVIHII